MEIERRALTAKAVAGEDVEYDVSKREDVHKLRRNAIGLWGVLFLTVTGAAPISAMLFNVPIAVGYGNGVGAPAGFAVATLILVIFSVGYVAMARKLTAVGGFYSYISQGLSRELGMAMGLSAVVAYSIFEAALAGGFAYFLSLKLSSAGIHIAWPFLALFMVVVIAILAYIDVRLSVAVLAVGLVSEVVILTIFDIIVFLHAGNGANVQLAAINPINAFQGFPAEGKLLAGAAGIGLFFAFWSWVGFEMAPNYAEESVNPTKIVPRALYISVIALGVFYTVTSWAALSGYASTHDAVAQAQNNASSFFFAPSDKLVGGLATQLMSILIITGSFACGMAFHNVAARYLYSLGREGLLPRVLGRTHHSFKSPHIASTVQSVIAALIIVAFAVFAGSNDPNSQAYLQLYGLMSIMGVIIILVAQALVSLAVLVYYERFHRDEVHIWRTRVAPVIAFVAQVVILYLLIVNVTFIGGGYALANWLAPIDLVIFLIGLGIALYLRSRDPGKYAQIGRLINNEGIEPPSKTEPALSATP